MKILVLLGGDSPEREVSLRSAKSVIKALEDLGREYAVFDPILGLDELKQACKGYDIVLPILHGKNGEDGVIQDVLEEVGVKYLGASGAVSRITIDKVKTHQTLEPKGILMPKYEVVNADQFYSSELSKKPFVLKPITGGSSIDTVIVRNNNAEQRKKVKEVLNKYDKMLLEELVEGLEIAAPVLGNKALPVINVVPPDGEEFDYENKYNGKTQEICPVPNSILNTEIQQQVTDIAVSAHKILGVDHLSRSEFIVTKEGKIYMLELNTIPGLTSESLYPKGARAAGLSMSELVEQFVNMTLGVA